jgi:ATP synthase F1 gamma subunit
MKPISQIKKDLQYSEDLAGIIDALKLMASAEFNSLSARMEAKDIVREEVINCFHLLTSVTKETRYFVENEDLPRGYLMICSDEGFLGEVNNAIADIALRRGEKKKAKYIVLGERGARILKDSGVEHTPFPGVTNNIPLKYIKDLAGYFVDLFKWGHIGSLYAIFTRFHSFTNHSTDVAKLLPCDDLMQYITATERGIFETLVEPDETVVMEYLVKLWLESNLYSIFWSSKLSEWSIRVMHLQRGSDELKEMKKTLRHKYFKSVHELNDKIIREITAARTLE